MSKRRKIALGVALVMVGLASWAWADYRCYEAYRSITPGFSQKQVVSALGRPIRDTPLNDKVHDPWQSGGQFAMAGEIVREYNYPVPLHPLNEWVIGFDADGRVILKSEVISP